METVWLFSLLDFLEGATPPTASLVEKGGYESNSWNGYVGLIRKPLAERRHRDCPRTTHMPCNLRLAKFDRVGPHAFDGTC
jgi:hypothetical protein